MNLPRCIYSQNILDQFKDLGFENLSWGNDLCDSIGLQIDNTEGWDHYFHIYLANSKTENLDNEEFKTCILQYHKNSRYVDDIFETDDIMELLSMFKTYNLTERKSR